MPREITVYLPEKKNGKPKVEISSVEKRDRIAQSAAGIERGLLCEHVMVVRKGGKTFRRSSGKKMIKGAEYDRSRMCNRLASKQVNGKFLCSAHFD